MIVLGKAPDDCVESEFKGLAELVVCLGQYIIVIHNSCYQCFQTVYFEGKAPTNLCKPAQYV